MSNDWVGLDDDAGGSQQVGGTQYVGVVETPDAPEVRAPRQPVRRVAPSARPVQNKSFVAREGSFRGSRKQESLVYFPTEFGAQVAINQEAAANMSKSKVHDVGGQRALRIQPGQYMVIVPESRFPEEPPRRARRQRPAEDEMSGMGTADAASIMASIGLVLDPLVDLGVGIAAGVAGSRRAEQEAALERLRIAASTEAAAAARQTATEEQRRQHTQNMARIRQQQAELNAINAGQTGAPSGSPVVAPTGGTSPVVWVAVAVVALGGIGGLVWFLSSRGKSEK